MNGRFLTCSDSIDFLKRVPPGSIDLAYIDPPWKPCGIQTQSDLLTLYLHTAALCKATLSDRGVIVWHAVPEMITGTRSVLDRVFYQDNFLTEFILDARRLYTGNKVPRAGHSNLVVYSKTENYIYQPPTRELSEEEEGRFNLVDSQGKRYRLDDLFASLDRPTLKFEWNGRMPPPGRSWRYSQERLRTLEDEGRIESSSSGVPMLRRFKDESPPPPLGSVWDDLALPQEERKETSGRIEQQAIKLADRILKAFTEEGSTILDPYCGSGSMVVAAERANRRWMASDSDEKAIEITRSRLGSGLSLGDGSIDKLEIHYRLTELLRDYKVDLDPHATDTHILVGRDESNTLEFKQTIALDVKKGTKEAYIELSAMKTIAAFLNSDGGILLVGVADDNSVVGIEQEVDKLFNGSRDRFLLHLKNMIKEKIGPDFYPLINQKLVAIDDKRVLRVDVEPSQKPSFIGNDFYVRTNPATDKLEGQKLLEYVNIRFSHPQQRQVPPLPQTHHRPYRRESHQPPRGRGDESVQR